VEELEATQKELQSQIEGVRQRIRLAGDESSSVLIDEETSLRRKLAAVRTMRIAASQAEARVAAMRDFIKQRQMEVFTQRNADTIQQGER
jgi:hypothetical protein